MTVEVIIPWRGGCPWRERALDYVRARYSWPIRLAVCPEGPWSKGLALAQMRSSADVVVVADADSWCDETAQAVDAVEGGAKWAVPHATIHRLTAQATEAVVVGAGPEGLPLEERPYRVHLGGGVVVLRRDVWESVPCDPRFRGWGHEDDSWGYALRVLIGQPFRGQGRLWHLWHPPADRIDRRMGSAESKALYRRYVLAARRRSDMAALVGEVVR